MLILQIDVFSIYTDGSKVHKQCQSKSDQILEEFKPNLMIAIGGGGYVPARILRFVVPPYDI